MVNQTKFLRNGQRSYSIKLVITAITFFAYYDYFNLKKKNYFLVHLIFLSSILMVSSSSTAIAVMLEIALLLSTSLLVTLEGLERKLCMVTAFWLLIIIIHMLNTIAYVAVNEMVQLLFEYYGDIHSRSYFLPTIKNVNNNAFQYVAVVLFSCSYVKFI